MNSQTALRVSRIVMALGVFVTLSGSVLVAARPGQDTSPSSDPLGKATEQKERTRVIASGVLEEAKQELVKKHGAGQRDRVERGLSQVASLWKAEDGDGKAFVEFTRDHFIADAAELATVLKRFEDGMEQAWGHFNEIGRALRRYTDLDLGPMLAIDRILGAYDVTSHLVEDFFDNKAAFIVLLNFPVVRLEEKLKDGPSWTRTQWAQARLAQQFSKRIPADVTQQITKASADGDLYIAEYNVWMHHLLDSDGSRLFPSGTKLISHWNLRDELKADYAGPKGLAKQRMIAKVMEHIVRQTIPKAVINNPRVDWAPFANTVRPAPKETIEADAPTSGETSGVGNEASPEPEPLTRYAHLLATFKAVRRADPFSPSAPTLILRRFEENRELPESRVEQLLKDVVGSPLVPRIAQLIEKRLGRKLEPFDIWYNGFQVRGKYQEAELDTLTRKKYPDVAAFQNDIPRILTELGFSPEKAKYLSERIVVDPARGAGHALGAQRRGDYPHLRTRFEKGGMTYKGYNIAIHELGHNVEQVFSLYNVDRTLLTGVPNTAFTEAMAFVFQARDLELLGLAKPNLESERLRVLNDFWMTYEICGPALVDMAVWHWMYDHPEASPAELKDAVIRISKDIWNRHYAPVFGIRDSVLLGIYSHMISLMMYIPDYSLGHLISFQIEEKLKDGKNIGSEMERMTSFGYVTPDLWMEHATGSPVSSKPLLQATEAALKSQGQ